MKTPLIAQIEAKQLKADVPDFRPGDTVRVHVSITEMARDEKRTRIQPFEGVVISRSGAGLSENFTVRRVTYGVGVERTFPIHAPVIDHIEVLRLGRVRRSRLYYIRARSGRASRIRERKVIRPKAAAPTTEKE